MSGADWNRIGREIAEDIVAECGAASGKSGKVAIVPGQLTAADSVIMNEAAFKVFEAHPEIEVVSNQASDWDPEKARQAKELSLRLRRENSAAMEVPQSRPFH